MYTSEGAPDFVVDQGLYYHPLDANYGYYSTGYESPGEWDNHQMFFGVDGSQVQYMGGQNENSPYICYQPSYGYAQSPYNPFNPYIPGASIAVDSPFVASQQFYSLPQYQNVVSSSPTYAPYAVQPETTTSSGSTNSLVETGSATRGRSRHNNVSANSGFQRNASKVPAANSFGRISEKPRPNIGQSKQPEVERSVSTPSSGLSVDEQNRGSRSKGSRNQLVVKAYTTKAGDADAEGNIVIDPNQYNKEDLRVDYSNAKFFVIKSYSEDDVHKSIKYNVWSSTLHGNKKLQSAYEDAQRIATEKSCECPIFLFFSVNASGLFCGMAEMTGPVSFDRDMDFWQQDKWSGSFPVKWHIIKDVPNSYFRHIILQNNENKPVTNSRDTQEIMLKQGLEVLKIFKGHAERTSLLDDFVYYENRQRVMYDERNRLPYRTFLSHSALPRTDLSDRNKKISNIPSVSSAETEDIRPKLVGNEQTMVKVVGGGEDTSSIEKIRSLSINPSGKDTEFPHLNESEVKSKLARSGSDKKTESSEVGDASASDDSGIVKVGSVPVKVTGSPAIVTVGTIPLDPKSLEK